MELNRLNALIKQSAALLLSTLAISLGSCSDHGSRMEKLRADHQNKYKQELAAQQDSLHWADSVLLEITPLINDMIAKGKFEFVKNEFDELGRFVVRGTDADNNLGRNYLHAAVTEYGVCQLISEYRGSQALNHVKIQLKGSDGTQSISKEVGLENDGANYRFQNQGVFHETVTFVADSVLAYIDLHADDSKLICMQVNGKGKNNTFNLTTADRKALSDSYRLGKALALQLRCSQTSKVAADKITLLKSKLEDKQIKENTK